VLPDSRAAEARQNRGPRCDLRPASRSECEPPQAASGGHDGRPGHAAAAAPGSRETGNVRPGPQI